ncbi:MAG: hypothetical protein GF355_06620 [Candidatus Eisenbacteria bacterium]|nr:hypothetical protein [Candidatus Eisenbacteria bacterium]
MPWIDISRKLAEETVVWPGDTPFSRSWAMSRDAGDACNTSTLTLSAHTGSHVDAPFHVHPGGATVDQLPVEPFIGRCRVVAAGTGAVGARDLAGLDLRREERILFRTRTALRDEEWRDEFTFLSPAAAQALADGEVKLVGIDTPSMDPSDSKSLEAHSILIAGRVAILEGLVLAHVTPGVYDLIAVPLRIVGGDASPVRALLRPAEEDNMGGLAKC